MKKFTKAIKKTILTLAAVLAFNAHAGDSAAPSSAAITYDAIGNFPAIYWAPGSNVENNGRIEGSSTGVQISNVLGKYYNNPDSVIKGWYEYGLYAKSNAAMSLLSIENYGYIQGTTGVNLVGLNGQLNNWIGAMIDGTSVGVQIDTETGSSSLMNGFTIHNEGQITSSNIGINALNGNKSITIENYYTGIISGANYAIAAMNPITINNENTILSQNRAAIYLLQGGIINNNGMIMSLNTTEDVGKAVSSAGNLTLQGTGSYQGDIEFVGSKQALSVLSLQSEGIDFKNSRLTNWSYLMVDGGKHYFNVVNDAQNSSYPRTEIVAHSNAYINIGAGGWGDANITLTGNSLLNPYLNNHDTGTQPRAFWDRPALKLGSSSQVLYDRKEFEKLVVNNITIEAGSGLVMDVRYSEPDYEPGNATLDEDDRVGYWDDFDGVENRYNPDDSYAGQGYSTRLKTVESGDPINLFLFQRVNYDTLEVRGTATIEAGAKIHLLEKTKWIEDDGSTPEFVEKPLSHLEINLFDGNINLDQFDWNIDYYSDYYGIESVDKVNGVIHLTRDAYHNVFSGNKGQIDWWLKQASLGFPSSNPAAAAQTALAERQAATQAATQAAAQAQAANSLTTVTDDGNVGTALRADVEEPTSMIGSALHADSMARRGYVLTDDGSYVAAEVNDDDDDDDAPIVIHPVEETPKSELLPYQVAKNYNAKITDLDKSLELRSAIYSFESWNDVDAFMDTLNKLEYASLATSNLNLISNRVNQMFDRLSAGHMRDNNGLNIWGDVYFSDDSLDGTGNHGIDGHGVEFAAGVDKMFNDTTFGLSATYTDYTSTVNDDDVHTDIESIGFGLNLYMMKDQGNLRHKAMLGYASYHNTGDDVQAFDSSEMFASYRAEWTIKTDSLEIKPFAGIRYSMVQFDEMREDAENGLKAFDQDSLETELGVKLVKQFNKLGVNVSGAWMHELLDSQTTGEAFTSFGNFSQEGIARDADSFRATIGIEYKLTDKVTLDFDYAKELSSNSESDSVNGKITFRF